MGGFKIASVRRCLVFHGILIFSLLLRILPEQMISSEQSITILKGLANVSCNRNSLFLCEHLYLVMGAIFILVFGIGIVRFENSICSSSNSLDGTCYTESQCNSINGYTSGRCAKNIGVCCVGKLEINTEQRKR